MSLEHWLAGAIMASLTLYALGAGADFGGGVWDLFSSGPRARRQREVIAHAIGPIWEANHVWLVLVVVLLFVAFPAAFAAIATALHVPLTIMLLGIVMRGSAFTFRSHDDAADAVQRRWGRVFAVASLITPLTLGACVGALASGSIRFVNGRLASGFFDSWTRPFALALGLFTLVLFAFLAAVYLTLEAGDREVQEDFRLRALLSGALTGVIAFATLGIASRDATTVHAALVSRGWSLPFQIVTGGVAVGALGALWRRRYALARALVVAQVSLVLWGWAGSQFPYAVPPDLTFKDAAAPPAVLRLLLWALAGGAAVLVPSLWWLFRVFKRDPATPG